MQPNGAFTEAVYRLRLMEAIFKEMQCRVPRSEDGKWEQSAIEDLLRLKNELPMPEEEEQWIAETVLAVLERCQSDLAREIQ